MAPFLELVAALFAETFGQDPVDIVPIAADGSARRYVRLLGPEGDTAVGGHGPDPEENRAFFSFSETFRRLGLPVPEVYAKDEAAGVWIGEDLGDTTLFDLLRVGRDAGSEQVPPEAGDVYRRVLEQLPRFQIEGASAIDFGVAYPRAAFDRQSILWDLNYFKYHFLKLAHVPFNEARLEKDFGRFARFLLAADREFFLYRDFQSRNVMVREGRPWFIDYQGGRRGALQYDVASLLYDAKADLPEALRSELLDHYLNGLTRIADVDRAEFLTHWPGYVLVRVLQALGAYGYRGFYERKPRFLQSVPHAARNVAGLLEAGLPVRLPEIESVLGWIVERWAPEREPPRTTEGLTVQIGSFRYSGGYPEDASGHGGFVFDCRGLPNPGREAEYRALNGLDPEVIAFLEARPEVDEFFERVRELAVAHVREYRRRGLHSLSVQFGCTGGQHRSVYVAERLAASLTAELRDIEVVLTHRETADWPRLTGSPTAG